MNTTETASEDELFDRIDDAIDSFKKNEGARKGIKVSKRPHSDWLVYKWRQLTWFENGIGYLIEVYPHFNTDQRITGWNLYTAAYYDHDNKRYYLNKTFAENKPLDFIADNSESLIGESYVYITRIKKEDIPFAVELK